MPTNPKKHQKKQERLAAKRKSKRHELDKVKHAGLPERMAGASRYPILHSWVTTDLWTNGMGWVCLSRELPNGSVAFGLFLVDRYCMGVKNAMAQITGRFTYDSQIERKTRASFNTKEMPPAAVRKLVEGAVEYAHALGLPPHPDYHKAQPIFGTIDPGESKEEFEFGQDGKPLFTAGPNDTPERCRRILKALEQSCGPDGFHYVIPFPEAGEVLPESLRQRKARLIGPDESGNIVESEIDFSEEEAQDGGESGTS